MSEKTQSLVLPTKKTPPSIVNPRQMIIFGQKKSGKSSLLSELEDNLILDFEGGVDFYTAMKLSIKNIDEFDAVAKLFHTEKPHYKYITIDTVTSLKEVLLNQLAVRQYNKDEGKNENYDFDVDRLAYGKGQVYKREALFKIMEFFTKYCDTLILVGHVADKSTTTTGQTIKELNLEGKLKDILALRVDAIGYLYRNPEKKNVNMLSFMHSEEVIGGSRCKHLRDKEFEISTLDENGDIVTNWDKIFI
jgi:hypothetical protein